MFEFRSRPGVRVGGLVVTGVVAITAGLGIAVGSAVRVFDHAPPLRVTVQQRGEYVSPTSTLGDAVSQFHLAARAGNLLDVQGQLLKPKVYPGQVLLDGREAPPATRLKNGDRITVVDGRDRTEPLVKELIVVPGGAPGDPQFYLGNAPGEEVVTKGKVSNKVVSTTFRPTGPLRRPPAVALTFDDGPWPGSTDQVLAILKRFRVKANFFLIGRQAQAYPDLVRAELSAGMVVGDHTWDHPIRPSFAALPPGAMRGEIASTWDALSPLGVPHCLFRPPGGSFSREVLAIAASLGCRVVLWSVDPRDWVGGRNARAIARTVLSSVRPGSIILLHDGGGNRSATIGALPMIIKGILKMRLRIEPVMPTPSG